MFDREASPQVASAAELDDAGVIDALGSAAREENAASAHRLAWMGELYARRAPEDDVERTCWAIDGHANVVAEIAAALNISRGRVGPVAICDCVARAAAEGDGSLHDRCG